MPRVFARRTRILPGPLRALSPAEHSSMPVAPLALASAAMAAGLLLMPHLSPTVSVDPTPMVEWAETASAQPQALAPPPSAPVAVAAATPVAVEAPVNRVEVPVAAPHVVAEPARPSAPPRPKPVADTSLFELDLLPVLQTAGADLDAGPNAAAAPQKAATRATARRTTPANRGAAIVATGGPAQP